MKKLLDDAGLDLIFREARSFNRWSDEKISDETLEAVIDLMKWGATSANCWPMRLVFVKSAEAIFSEITSHNPPKESAFTVKDSAGINLVQICLILINIELTFLLTA